MKNGVGKKTRILVVCTVVLALISIVSSSNANLVIDDTQINLMSTNWYNGSSKQFQLNYAGIPGHPAIVLFGIVSTTGSASYDYQFNGTVSITPADLLEDQTVENGGWAKGVFAGGSTLTIAGSLWNRDTSEYIITDDTILVAQMSTDDWYLAELPSPPAAANLVRGSAFFSTIGGGLFNGNNSAGLTMYGFRADFTFPGVNPVATTFGSTTYNSFSPTIQTVPEPASISLFCLAVLAVIRKRKM